METEAKKKFEKKIIWDNMKTCKLFEQKKKTLKRKKTK